MKLSASRAVTAAEMATLARLSMKVGAGATTTPDAAPGVPSADARLAVFAGLGLLGALAVGLVLYNDYQRAVRDTFREVDDKQLLMVEEARGILARTLGDAERLLSSTRLLRLVALDDNRSPPEVREEEMRSALEALSPDDGLLELLIVRADSDDLLSPRGRLAPPARALLEDLRIRARRQPDEIHWSHDAPALDGSFLMARALDVGGVPSGELLAVRISLPELYAARLSGLGIGPTGYAWVLDGAGTIVLAPPPSQPGSRPFATLDPRDEFAPIYERMMKGRSGFGRYRWREPDGSADVRRIAFTQMSVLGQRLVVAESASEREVVSQLRSVAQTSLLLGGTYLAVVVLAGSSLIRVERARRRRTEELVSELAASEERHRLSLDEAPAAILEIDIQSGTVTSQNKHARDLLGRSLTPPPAIRDLVPVDEHRRLDAALDDLRGRGSATFADIDLLTHDGVRIPVEIRGKVLGPSSAAQLVATDLRDRRAVEERLRAQDRLATLGLLTAGIAHELKNPVSYVLANAEELRRTRSTREESGRQPASSDEAEMVDDIVSGAERLRDMIASLGVIGSAPQHERFLLKGAVDDAVKVAWHRIRYRASLASDVEDVAVHGSRTELVQVVLNLLVNAVQAFGSELTPRENQIRIAAHRQGGQVELSVTDNGPGIPPSVLPHVFDRFFTTKSGGAGSGLGLWIARSAIERMGGRLEAESVLGQGATFRILLPEAPADLKRSPSAVPEPTSAPLLQRQDAASQVRTAAQLQRRVDR